MPHTRTSDDAVTTIADQWTTRVPDLDVSPLLVLGRLQRVHGLVDAALRPPLAAAGLAPGDFDLLAALRRLDDGTGVASRDLAAAMLVTAGATTKRADRLIASGLATRSVADDDGRERRIALTRKGRTTADRLMRSHLAREAELLAGLGARDQQRLADLLAQLLEHVEPEVSPAGAGTGRSAAR
ncbi:MarR family transcriptional regulator [Angustibacter peucedani]